SGIAQGGHRRFLHDISHLASENQAPFPFHCLGLYVENLTARWRPSEPGRDADLIMGKALLGKHPALTQELSKVRSGQRYGHCLPKSKLHSNFPADRRDLPFQIAQSCLARVPTDYLANDLIGNQQVLALKSVGCKLPRYEVAP